MYMMKKTEDNAYSQTIQTTSALRNVLYVHLLKLTSCSKYWK